MCIRDRPVVGEDVDRSILLPLLVCHDPAVANEGASMKTFVEASYVSTHEALSHNGTLGLAQPGISLPLSVLTTHLSLPDRFNYTFGGDFKKPADRLAYPLPPALSYKTGKRIVEKEYKFSSIDDVWAAQDRQKTSPTVKIATPNTGRSFYFHRLLVVDSDTTLNTKYFEIREEMKTSWWSYWWPTSYLGAAILMVAAILIYECLRRKNRPLEGTPP